MKNYHNLKKQLSLSILIKYVIAGGLVAVIYFLILKLLVNLNVNYSISIFVAYFSTAVLRFFMHFLWVYSEKTPEFNSSSKRYIFLLLTSYIFNNIFVQFLLFLGLPKTIVIIMSTVFVSIYGIILSTLWVFISKK